MGEATFVTAFHNIGRETEKEGLKFENYFARIDALLALSVNIVFFTTREIHDRLRYTPRPNLIFRFEEAHPWNAKLVEVSAAWARCGYITNAPDKDTPAFACLTLSKFSWLLSAIESNPFSSTHFAWIDAGLFKVAVRPELLPNLKIRDKVRCMLLNYIGAGEVQDPRFVCQCSYKIAGGFFSGSAERMRLFAELVLAEAQGALDKGYFGLEQEFMAIVYRKHPGLFDPYYGDFADLLQNYMSLEGTFWLVWRTYQTAKNHGDTVELERVRNYILASEKFRGHVLQAERST